MRYNSPRQFFNATTAHSFLLQHKAWYWFWGGSFMELNRNHHTYIIGQTGQGKSTLLKSLILKDIAAGDGVFFVDPHGHDTDDLLGRIPPHRKADVILFDPSQSDPIAWNPLADVAPDTIPFVATTLVETIKDAWGYADTTTPTMDQYLYNTTFALIEAQQPLIGIKFMLTSEKYRRSILDQVTDPIILDFWRNDFERMSAKDRRDTTRSTLNKVGALLSDARIRNCIGQQKSAFSFPAIIRDRKIFLARLPQGKLGISKAKLIGSLLLTQVHLAALARTDDAPFRVHLDEVHNFAGATLVEMLSGIRKFNVSVTVVHQYLDQLTRKQLSSILGNAGTKVMFRVSAQDGKVLDDLVGDNQLLFDLHLMPKHKARVVEGDMMKDFDMVADLPPYDPAVAKAIVAGNHRHFSRRRATVEAYINRFIQKT